MRRGFSSLFLLIFPASCSSPIKNLDSKGENIICFGDSITYGAGAGKGLDYPSILAKFIGRKVINAGISGDTAPSALDRIARDVFRKRPLSCYHTNPSGYKIIARRVYKSIKSYLK